MNKRILRRLMLFTVLALGSVLSVKAGAINDPVVSVLNTSTLQQAVSVSVTVTGAPSGTTIYYTTDGTNPSMSSPSVASGGSFLVAQNATLRVEAFQNATTTSNIVTAKFAMAGMVSAGTAHTLILKNDGTVWATGDNTGGELGNGTTNGTSTPVQVMMNATTYLTGVIAIAADNEESFAVDGNGLVWAWGLNTSSQLGIGTSANALYATQVGSISNMVAIASSQNHTLSVRADGAVFGWGANTNGQVGNGSTGSWVTTPTQVLAPSGQSGYLTGIVAVAAGANHSLALTNAGTVFSWGSDTTGQLGNGDSTLAMQTRPVQVLHSGSALNSVVAIAAGTSNSYAMRIDGTDWSWGDNTIGELGQGTTSLTPITANLSAGTVNGLSGSMTSVSNQTALGSDGTMWTWGDNSTGKLGVGYVGYYATLPLDVTLSTQSAPTLTTSAGNGQTVNDGSFSSPFTITVTSGGTPLANTWVNLLVNPSYGSLGLSSGSSQLSPIIGGRTNSNGQISFYLDAASNGSGSVSLTALSGASQSGLSAIEQAVQMASSGEPLPEWVMLVMAVALIYFATRPKTRPVA